MPPHGVAFSLFMVCKLAGSLVYVLLQQRGAPVHSLLNWILGASAVSLAARRPGRHNPENASPRNESAARTAPPFLRLRLTRPSRTDTFAPFLQLPVVTRSYASALVAFCVFEAAFGAYWPALATLRAEILPVRDKPLGAAAWRGGSGAVQQTGAPLALWRRGALTRNSPPFAPLDAGLDAVDRRCCVPHSPERPRRRRAPPGVVHRRRVRRPASHCRRLRLRRLPPASALQGNTPTPPRACQQERLISLPARPSPPPRRAAGVCWRCALCSCSAAARSRSASATASGRPRIRGARPTRMSAAGSSCSPRRAQRTSPRS